MSPMRIGLIGVIAAITLLLSSCGGGGATNSAGLAQADYVVLDLVSGKLSPMKSLPTLLTDPAYRTTKLAMVALPGGVITSGAGATELWAQPGDGELPGTASSPRVFMTVFELTQSQWSLMAATTLPLAARTPWTSAAIGGTPDAEAPAFGMSLAETRSLVAAASARYPGAFKVPTSAQWEYACRAGTIGSYSWGETRDGSIATWAVVAETRGISTGPQRVGPRLPNAFGLYDMHGNLWEHTDDNTALCAVRGGSWIDSMPMARSANRILLDPATPHALVGARLVFRADAP